MTASTIPATVDCWFSAPRKMSLLMKCEMASNAASLNGPGIVTYQFKFPMHVYTKDLACNIFRPN